MAAQYLLDTNTISYFLKGSTREIRQNFMSRLASELAVSAISEAELRYWIAVRPLASQLSIVIDAFLARIPSLPWDAAAAGVYGNLRARLKQMGRPVADLDMLIASHALSLNAILVTHDKVFMQIPGLKTEDWMP